MIGQIGQTELVAKTVAKVTASRMPRQLVKRVAELHEAMFESMLEFRKQAISVVYVTLKP